LGLLFYEQKWHSHCAKNFQRRFSVQDAKPQSPLFSKVFNIRLAGMVKAKEDLLKQKPITKGQI
jgi:hypothetical protein